jgi:hypothetical protein
MENNITVLDLAEISCEDMIEAVMTGFCVTGVGLSEGVRSESVTYSNAAVTEEFISSANVLFSDAVSSSDCSV